MKAIQIKRIPCTNTKPDRLKVWAEGTKPVYSTETDSPYKLAKSYAESFGWLAYNSWTEKGPILVEGQLPNGDYCYTFYEV